MTCKHLTGSEAGIVGIRSLCHVVGIVVAVYITAGVVHQYVVHNLQVLGSTAADYHSRRLGFTQHVYAVVGDVHVGCIVADLDTVALFAVANHDDLVVHDIHRNLFATRHLSQRDGQSRVVGVEMELVSADFEALVIQVSHLCVDTVKLLRCGVVFYAVVANLRSQLVRHIQRLGTLVAQDIVLYHSAYFLRQSHIACSAHSHTDVSTLEQTVLHCEIVVVLVSQVLCIGIYQVDVL